jgi:hypothetical protein
MRFVHGPIYVGIALVLIFQVFATVDGVAHLTGWGPFASWLIAIVMGWVPLLGTTTAIYGAIAAWNWPWYGAVTWFTWPIALMIARFAIAIVQSRV